VPHDPVSCHRFERRPVCAPVSGRYGQSHLFNDSPANQAAEFEASGFEWLHLVDLNGAFAGKPVNGDAVEAILEATNLPAQLGGGIRDLATIEMWLNKGIKRVILGTIAVNDPDLVREACKLFPGQVAVGIDARDGMVAVEGWAEVSSLTAIDLAAKSEDAGVAAIIYTDIERDGAMKGVNVASTAALARATSIPVIASGGVASVEDLKALKAQDVTFEGVISGRAIYDGRLDAQEALEVLR